MVEKKKTMAAAETSACDDPIHKLEISIQCSVQNLSPLSNRCIFTVPEKLQKSKREAYKPRVIAIGPYHHNDPSLMLMEDHKRWYLQSFLEHNQKYHLKDYFEMVKLWEDEARSCYDKHIKLQPNEFAEIMLLDGIFVIQLFLMYSKNRSWLQGDWIFDKPYMLNDVRRDMALLENQIPFFVIQRLFKMALGTHQKHMPKLLELVWLFFKPVMRMETLPEWAMESEVKHFVDVIRLSFFPSSSMRKVPNESHKQMKFTPTATELVAAGVKLTRGESKCLLDIEFENGVLTIPYLALYDSTESYYRNIIAFEQCYHIDRYLTDYLAFIDHLVDTPDDAESLIKNKIIEDWLSNKEAVTQLINSFGMESDLSKDYYFYGLSDKLTKHYDKLYNQQKAAFKRKYCSSPWMVISTVAAVVLLLLTITQTVCSILTLICKLPL